MISNVQFNRKHTEQRCVCAQVNDLTHQRGDLTLRCQTLALEHAAALHPINARLRVEVDTLRGEAEEERNKVANAVREMEEARMRMMQVGDMREFQRP